MSEKIGCEDCKMRARYDAHPKSLMGRFWRWHINWCPGWKKFIDSLSDERKSEIRIKYNIK